MKVFLLFYSLISPFILYASGDLEKYRNMNIPFVEIETVNGEEPYSESIHRPEGCLGDGITNVTKVPGSMKIWKLGKIVYSSGDYEKDISGITIRHRGNTSAAFHEKKPLKIKLQKKADLLFRADSEYKDKDWLLLRGTTLYEDLAWTIDKALNDKWVPSFEYCNMSINGDYRGVYLLCESVKKSKGRINIGDGGFLFEYDAYWWNEPMYIPSRWNYEFQYTLKYPDPDDITEDEKNYLTDYINQLETTMDEGTYEDYIDISSWVRWMLVHDILGSYDQAGSNKFLVKYEDSDKVYMGPVWDFDGIETTKDNWARIHYFAPFGSILFPSANKAYSKAYVELWNSKKQIIENAVNQWLQNKSDDSVFIQEVNLSREMDYERWGEDVLSVEDELNSHKLWFSDRFLWLDSNINNIDIGTSTIIKDLNSDNIYKQSNFNVLGVPVSTLHKGLIISGGNKYLKK